MTAEQVFSLCNSIALVGWIVLIGVGRIPRVRALITGAIIPLLLAIVYLSLVLTQWGRSQGGFGSLAAVSTLFANPWMLLAGWVHYLAFDLFIGSWEARDAVANRISLWWVIPCQAVTFMFGPIGLLLYFAIRTIATRSLDLDRGCAKPV